MLALGFQHVSLRVAVVCPSLFLNLWHPNAGADGLDCIPRGRPNRSNTVHPHQESGRLARRSGLPSH